MCVCARTLLGTPGYVVHVAEGEHGEDVDVGRHEVQVLQEDQGKGDDSAVGDCSDQEARQGATRCR